jgi:uncharacterized protein (TIGR04222 family)
MLGVSEAALANSIDAFAFDAPDDAEPFVTRLARENGWDEGYAARVSIEYRRFLTLFASANHPVAPSDEVDQAWHLHLLDSLNYRRFCDRVLGRPLDHVPSRGGPFERQRLISDYRQTLRSYRKHFGGAPPADIWPEAEQRFGAGMRARRVKLQDYWLVPKPTFRPSALPLGLLAAVLSLCVAGCAIEGRSPGSLTGPQFIHLYLGIWVVSVLVAWGLRRPSVADAKAELPELHPYEVAQLSGGPALAVDSALTALLARGKLVCDHAAATLRASPEPLGPAHPLEQDLHASVAQKSSVAVVVIRERAGELTAQIGRRLHGLGLTRRGSGVLFWIAMTAPLVGGLRLLSRMGSDRPIGGLVLLCLLGVLLASLVFWRGHGRTAAGDALLVRLRQEHEPLRELPPPVEGSASAPLALSVALFGLGILASTPLSEWSALVAAKASAAKGSGGCGSGGCGAACGSGGCGGGCGGCGGCGG